MKNSSKLDKLLLDILPPDIYATEDEFANERKVDGHKPVREQAKQQIKDLMLDIIGEDEVSLTSKYSVLDREIINQLKAEQRTRIKDL